VAYRLKHFRAASFAIAAITLSAWGSAGAQTPAQSPADFYRGRTVNVIVGFSPGGSFDLYARTLSRHIGRHIPGNPTVVVQNMPGAGSLKAVSYLFSVAPRDGTVLATFNHTIPIEPLLGRAKFDPRQLEWLGSVASESSVCIASSRSPVNSLDDLRTTPFSMGGTGRGSDTDMFASVFRTTLGLPLRLVTGYPGTSEMMLAVQSGELDGFCGIFYSSLLSAYPDVIKTGKIKIIGQAAIERDPAMPNVPMLLDYARTERQRQIMMLLIGPQVMARPFAMPPGTSAARVGIMRRAFEAMMADPAFLAQATAARMVVSPVNAAKVAEVVNQLYRTPPDVLTEAAKAFGN
jgi:tripartite-type tricarboxylate transporter receptor subunit TctC